jgi:NADH:ubiquinone oxidoreductase subunit F (NADH-binding)
MYNLLNKIYSGKAMRYELEQLETLCTMVREMSLCGLFLTRQF